MTGTTVNSATNGFTYDNAGDVTNDNLNQYAYDAEGRLCAVSSRLGGNGVGYIYDAGGTRVAKGTITSLTCNPATDGFTVTNSYVLGLGGEQFSEVTVSGSTDTWAHTNIFAGGKLLATYNGTDTYFDLTDWLGTKRAEYTPDGLSSTFYSGPFGGGLSSSGNAVDASEQHFTGKERDAESGLDDFGARYYGSTTGRFMTPDPSGLAFADPTNPQSLNLYSYVFNNPLSLTDPSGLDPCIPGDGDEDAPPCFIDPGGGGGGGDGRQCISNCGRPDPNPTDAPSNNDPPSDDYDALSGIGSLPQGTGSRAPNNPTLPCNPATSHCGHPKQTTCSSVACHKEPSNIGGQTTPCSALAAGLLGFGIVGGPWVEGPLAYVFYGVGVGGGIISIKGC